MASGSEVFILGGGGLVGSAFARHCQLAGRPFTVIEPHNYASVAGGECDVLVNANGNSSKRMATSDPLGEFDASVRSVRAALTDFRFRKYVQISSCDVYPDCSSPATTREEQALDPARQSPYGFHKRLAEQCVEYAARDWLIFRCGGFIGPGLKKNAIFDLLNLGPVYLDPESELQFLHTDSAAAIVFDLVDRGLSREMFNQAGTGVIRLSEAAALRDHPARVFPGSPRVRYEISLEKISRYAVPPETGPAVLEFVRAQLHAAGRLKR